MIGASDLYRLPRATVSTQPEELHRYARLELNAAVESLALTASASPVRRTAGFRAWLAARLPVPHRAAARTGATRRTGLAAVHFDGATGSEARTDIQILPVVHSGALVASGSFVFPAHSDTCRGRDEVLFRQ